MTNRVAYTTLSGG